MKNMIPNTGCPSIWKQTGGINKQFPKRGKKRQDCQVSARGKQWTTSNERWVEKESEICWGRNMAMNQMERIAKLAAAKPEKQPIPRSWSTHSSVPAPRSKGGNHERVARGKGREPHQPPRSPPGGIDEPAARTGRRGNSSNWS